MRCCFVFVATIQLANQLLQTTNNPKNQPSNYSKQLNNQLL